MLDDLPWKDERGPSSFRQTLQLFQRQCWGNFWEMEWSADGLFRTHRYHLELNWTTLVSPQNQISFVGCFCFRLTWLKQWWSRLPYCQRAASHGIEGFVLPAMITSHTVPRWPFTFTRYDTWVAISHSSFSSQDRNYWMTVAVKLKVAYFVVVVVFVGGGDQNIYMFQLDSCSSILPDKQTCYQDVKVHNW